MDTTGVNCFYTTDNNKACTRAKCLSKTMGDAIERIKNAKCESSLHLAF